MINMGSGNGLSILAPCLLLQVATRFSGFLIMIAKIEKL